MAIKKSELYSSLWASCDELRGGMDPSQYKGIILVLLFVKYVSDKYANDPDAIIEVPEGGSFKDMQALKGNKDIGNQINIIIGALAGANNLDGVINVADFADDDKLGKGKEMVDTKVLKKYQNSTDVACNVSTISTHSTDTSTDVARNVCTTLTETEMKQLVVDDKWTASIERSVKTEMERISQRLTQRIKELTTLRNALAKTNRRSCRIGKQSNGSPSRNGIRMELKAGYKQTEIGIIPSDWKVEYIKNLAIIKTGSRNTQDRIESGLYPFFVRSQTVERINSYSFDGEAVLTAGNGVGVGKVIYYVIEKFDCPQYVYFETV